MGLGPGLTETWQGIFLSTGSRKKIVLLFEIPDLDLPGKIPNPLLANLP